MIIFSKSDVEKDMVLISIKTKMIELENLEAM